MRMAAQQGRSTPLPTKVALVATLTVTATALAVYLLLRSEPTASGDAAVVLALFTGLFALRVVGQLFVRVGHPHWLPPTEQWNLMPYRWLLPSQLGILALMTWIDLDFARGHGFWTDPRPALGSAVLAFALLYAAIMVARYVARMRRRPEERWFGGTIPIAFHFVLAGYLLVFGSFHASY
jgi:uncharacterized protein